MNQILDEIELVLARTPAEEWTPVIRGYITGQIHALLQALVPYVDGTMGPVSSKHVQNQLTALNLLGRVHRVFDPVQPQVTDPDTTAEKLRQVQRDKVRAQMLALEERAAGESSL